MSDYSDMARLIEPFLAAHFLGYDATRDLGRGNAFPVTADVRGGLVADDRFFRTDLDFACVYDGTRWLTQHEYVLPLVSLATIAGNTDSGNVPIPAATTYGIYVTRVTIVTNVAATNNGANYWSLQGQGLNTANSAADALLAFNTSADAAATYVVHEGISISVPTNKTWYRTNASKTGAPGNLTYAAALNYRLIIT